MFSEIGGEGHFDFIVVVTSVYITLLFCYKVFILFFYIIADYFYLEYVGK